MLPDIMTRGVEAEANPNDWWAAVNRLLKDLNGTIHLEEVSSVCVGGQGPTVVPIDREARPLHNALIWMDRRASDEANRIGEATGDKADSYLFESKVLWIKNHAERVYERTYKFLSAYDFISYKLTGRPSTGVLRAGRIPWWTIPYWAPEHLQAVGVDLEKMAEPVLVGETLGGITAAASGETGLKQGTRVVQGVTDFAHDILGGGVSQPGLALDHGGTSQGFDLCWQRDLPDHANRTLSSPHIIPEYWNISGLMSTTGALLRWFRDNFCEAEVGEARLLGFDPYDLMGKLAAQIGPGSNGLLVLPYFAGERSPIWDAHARGIFFGLSQAHTRAHLIRAVMEGVAYAIRHVNEVITELGGSVREIRAVGGQSRSDLWNQIKSDILDLPVVTVDCESTASLGAAITAAFGTHVFSSLREGSERVVRVRKRFEPNAANHARYNHYFAVYKKLYPSLKDCFRELEA